MPARVQRTDHAWEALMLPAKNGAGLMTVEGYLTGSGVFPYPQEDGTILLEWRPPAEVSDATSLDSLKLAPVTIEHPAEMVTIENIAKLGVGTVGDDVRTERQWPDVSPPFDANKPTVDPDVKIRARLRLVDAKAIKVIEDKTLPEVSCGYSADLDMTPGITPDGQRYDAVQRRIVYNHVAIGVVGRQGPGVSIRVDSKPPPPKKEEPTMKKLILDGVSYDAPEQTIEAVTASQAKAAVKLSEAVDALAVANQAVSAEAVKTAQAEARADASASAEKAAKAEAKAANDRIKAGVKERLSLERSAMKAMGNEAFEAAALGDADDDAVRVAVIKHLNPDRDLSEKLTSAGKGDLAAQAYIAAAFDFAATAAHSDSNDGGDDDVRADSAGSLKKASTTAVHVDAADKARADRIAKRNSAYLPKA